MFKKRILILIMLILFTHTIAVAEVSSVTLESFNPLIYKDNYQQEINKLKVLPKTDDTLYKINLLIYYRIRKIATDLDSYEKYLTSDDINYLNGTDIACFSDKPALSNLQEYNTEWDKTSWVYDEETKTWTKIVSP